MRRKAKIGAPFALKVSPAVNALFRFSSGNSTWTGLIDALQERALQSMGLLSIELELPTSEIHITLPPKDISNEKTLTIGALGTLVGLIATTTASNLSSKKQPDKEDDDRDQLSYKK